MRVYVERFRAYIMCVSFIVIVIIITITDTGGLTAMRICEKNIYFADMMSEFILISLGSSWIMPSWLCTTTTKAFCITQKIKFYFGITLF